jgi:hypothetical protein
MREKGENMVRAESVAVKLPVQNRQNAYHRRTPPIHFRRPPAPPCPMLRQGGLRTREGYARVPDEVGKPEMVDLAHPAMCAPA